MADTPIRNDWTADELTALYALPFMDLILKAQLIHRQHFDPNTVQTATLLSIKTGACPEDCTYCPQSARYKTDIQVEKMMSLDKVITYAKRAKESGATRFCMGAAFRSPKQKDIDATAEMIKAVKALGLQTCVTLGMLDRDQAHCLKDAGLDYYNHNLDTSPEYYAEITTTRTYEDRLETLENLRAADIKVCCGGIVGMGESRADRIGLLLQLANQSPHPQSVPINMLVRVKGTPLANEADFDRIEFIRTIAIARIIMPKSFVRLSAGRTAMSQEMQALCFFAGANSIHYGEKLLTTNNPTLVQDQDLFQQLGMTIMDGATLDAVECSNQQ